jgi:O-antigen/teichoic acid export membrane protein
MHHSGKHIFHSLIKGTAISFSGSLLIGLVNYLTRRTLVLNLTVSDYGFIYAAISLLSLTLAVSDLGLGKAIVMQAAPLYVDRRQRALERLFSVSLLIKVGVGLCLALLFILLTPWGLETFFHYSDGHLIFYIFLIWFFFANIMGVATGFLEAAQRFLCRNLLFLLNYSIILLFIVFFIGKLGPLAASIAFALGAALSFAAAMVVLRTRFKLTLNIKLFSGTYAKDLFHYTKWIAFSTAGLSVMPHIDTLMLTFFHGPSSSGEYNIVLPIVQIIQSTLIFSTIFIPIASQLWHGNRQHHLRSALTVATLALSLLFTVGCMVLHLCGRSIIALLFNETYAYLSPIVTLLSIGMSFFLLGQLHLDTLNIAQKTTTAAKIIAVGVLVNVVANLALIPTHTLFGAAIATSVSYLTIFIMAVVATRRSL